MHSLLTKSSGVSPKNLIRFTFWLSKGALRGCCLPLVSSEKTPLPLCRHSEEASFCRRRILPFAFMVSFLTLFLNEVRWSVSDRRISPFFLPLKKGKGVKAILRRFTPQDDKEKNVILTSERSERGRISNSRG